jgi:hypothetical protein
MLAIGWIVMITMMKDVAGEVVALKTRSLARIGRQVTPKGRTTPQHNIIKDSSLDGRIYDQLATFRNASHL